MRVPEIDLGLGFNDEFHLHPRFRLLLCFDTLSGSLSLNQRGNVDLTLSLPFFGGTQLELLCGVTSTLLLITHFIMIFNIKERILQKPTDG